MQLPDRYRCAPIRQTWSPDSILARRIAVWRAASAAAGHPWDGNGHFRAVDVEHRAAALEAQYGHDIAAQCEALREALRSSGQDEAAHWLHYGLCSSDVADGALLLTLDRTTSILSTLAAEAANTLTASAPWHFDAVIRTHGQAAQIAPAGARWAGLADQLEAARTRLIRADTSISAPGFNGPTGTGGVLTPEARAQIAETALNRGVSDALGSQATPRGGHIAWAHAVTGLTDVCAQFGLALRLLAQTGIGEVKEPTGVDAYRGSSSMPHKRNPTRSERLCGIAGVARGLASGYQQAASTWWDAHSLEHSVADRLCLPALSELAGFALLEVAAIAQDLEWDTSAAGNAVIEAPEDSFARRNALIEVSEPGTDTWTQARH